MDILKGLGEPPLRMRDIANRIRAAKRFVVCGEPRLAGRVAELLDGIGKETEAIVPCGRSGAPPVRGAGAGPDLLLVVASYDEQAIARRLGRCGLAFCRDYIFFDQLDMVARGLYRGAFGRDFYRFLRRHGDEFRRVSSLLGDRASRETYRKVLRFRVNYFRPERIGARDLPTAPGLQQRYARAAAFHFKRLSPRIPEALRRNIAFKMSMNQYAYSRGIGPENKKAIFNVGAYNNTSVMFALASPKGAVYAFEPQGALHRANVAMAALYPNIRPVRAGLWRTSGTARFTRAESLLGGTTHSAVAPGGDSEIRVYALDDFVRRSGIECVDYIKIDVEGAELDVLAGARRTIREHRPVLAVSIYHLPSHLYAIPLWIKRVQPAYRLFIAHGYYNPTETVCFAAV